MEQLFCPGKAALKEEENIEQDNHENEWRVGESDSVIDAVQSCVSHRSYSMGMDGVIDGKCGNRWYHICVFC